MNVRNLNKEINDGRVRVSATFTWEDCDRPERQIYIESDVRYADDMTANPNAFLLASIIPAMHHGERRVQIDGTLCPQLRNGLISAMHLLASWYGGEGHNLVEIEATQGFKPMQPNSKPRVASFMSGGVDSLATLRRNRLDFPLEHPGSIRDCFLVHGVDLGGYENLDRKKRNFEFAVALLNELALEAQISLITVYMNLRFLDDSDNLFGMESHGALLSAIAHTFSNRITSALIASTSFIRELTPWGSHPLLDPNYSSADVSIHHDCVGMTRLEKVGLLVEWDSALRHLRSCFHPFRPDNVINCGKCEKCLRTMTELLVYSKLQECSTFPFADVTPEMLAELEIVLPSSSMAEMKDSFIPVYLDVVNVDHWRQLIHPLNKIGRNDLAVVIESKLAAYEKYRARMEGMNWKGVAKRLDQVYLSGFLKRFHQRLKQRGSISTS